MKYWLLLIFPFCAIAQENFKVEDQEIIWQKVYNDTTSIVSYDAAFRIKPLFIDSRMDGSSIYGKTKPSEIIKERSGLAIFARYPISFNYLIQFKDGRYRVTLSDITFIDPSDGIEIISTYLLKKDQTIRDAEIHQRFLERFDKQLDQLFIYTNADKW